MRASAPCVERLPCSRLPCDLPLLPFRARSGKRGESATLRFILSFRCGATWCRIFFCGYYPGRSVESFSRGMPCGFVQPDARLLTSLRSFWKQTMISRKLQLLHFNVSPGRRILLHVLLSLRAIFVKTGVQIAFNGIFDTEQMLR